MKNEAISILEISAFRCGNKLEGRRKIIMQVGK
jgi:hypothetical protein